MKTKALIPLAVGLALGIVALKLVSDAIKRAQAAPAPDKSALVDVYTAAEDITRGQLLTEERIKAHQLPQAQVPEWGFTDPNQLVGRVAKSSIYAGEFIHSSALMPEGTKPGLPVPVGYRAVAVKIDESSGVDYHLEPGSRVDVMGFFTIKRGRETDSITIPVVENVEVAAVGPRISAEEEQSVDGKTTKRSVRAVTLFVKPEQVPLVMQAENRGRIKLSMRSGAEEFVPTTPQQPYALGSQLLGQDQPEPEPEPEQSADSGWGWKAREQQKEQIAATPTPAPTPARPEPPKIAHVTVIHNGPDSVTFLAWHEGARRPVELTPTEYERVQRGLPPQAPDAAMPRPSGEPNPDRPSADLSDGASSPVELAQSEDTRTQESIE